MKKQVFTLKTYGAQLYKWSPESSDRKAVKREGRQQYCNAVAFSQGQDWITTYVYDIKVVNSQQERSAYVACDYVQ